MLAEVDRLNENEQGAQAGEFLLAEMARLQLQRTDAVLWRLSRAVYQQSAACKAAGDAAQEEALLKVGIAHAEEALALNERCAMAHKWYAICKGSLTAFVPTKEKIELGFVFRTHVLRAIELNPTDGINHFLLGRWCFEVASLSWWERKAAAALFAAPPEATFDETLDLFLRAEELRFVC